MEDSWKTRYQEKVALLEATEHKYQQIVEKCNELIKEKNHLISEVDHVEKKHENLKVKSKEFQAKLLLQVGTLQNEKKSLTKENEILTAENQNLKLKNFDSETFLNSLRDEILDFRDKKNTEIQKLEQQLAEAKKQISVTSPVNKTEGLPGLSQVTQEVLVSENERLRRELRKFKSIQIPLRNPGMTQRRFSQFPIETEEEKLEKDFGSSAQSFDEIKQRLKRSTSVEKFQDYSGKSLNLSQDRRSETETAVDIVSEKLLRAELLRNELKSQLTNLETKLQGEFPANRTEEKKQKKKKSSIAQLIVSTGGSRARKRSIFNPSLTLLEVPVGT